MKKPLCILLVMLLASVPACIAESVIPPALSCYGIPSETSVLLHMTNGTQKPISQLRIRVSVQDTTPIEMLPDLLHGDIFPSGATIGIWFDLLSAAGQDAASPLYEIMITFTDDQVWMLHNVPVADIEEAVLFHDEHVVWLTYTSLTSGQPISTWLDELNILAAQEADHSALADDAQPEVDAEDENFNS